MPPSTACYSLRKGELLTTRGSATAATDTYRAATIDIASMSGPHLPPPDPTHPDPKTTPGSCPRAGAWGAPHRPWVGAARRLRRAADSAPEGAEEVLTDILRVLVCPTFAPECKASRFAQPAPVARVPPVCVL